MNKLLLIDGHNLLFQMFYGMPSRITNARGEPIQGTLGFTGALLRIIRMLEPTHIAVLFDGEHENPRAALDADYKANRAADDRETPFEQLPDVYRVLEHLGIAHAEISVGETDDAIASYARNYASELDIFIVSQDSDYYQLIGETVRIVRYRGDLTTVCGANFVQDKFGITPDQYADFKAMCGDKSDNIRGAPKIGPKTAAALLRQFGSLDAILARSNEIARPSIRASISENCERLRRNRALILLDGSGEMPFSLDELAWKPVETTTNIVLTTLGIK